METIMEIKGGKNRNIEIEILKKEYEKEEYGKKYKQYSLKVRVRNHIESLELIEMKDYKCIRIWKGELFGFKRGPAYIVIDDRDYEKLKELKKEIEKENERLYEEFIKSIELKFRVEKRILRLLDMDYEAKVFVQNRAMTEEEEERYNELLTAVKMFNKDKYHLDGFIDASEFEEGQEFTLDELEEIFSEELQKYKDYLKKKEEEERKAKEEYERKKQEALKKAKETGKEVVIRVVGSFDGDDPANDHLLRMYGLGGYRETNEYGLVIVYEVATPDGKIVHRAEPTY